ncbi:WD40 repeat domain-containing protein [Iningainema tapete]|uniref:WD40 repeat domain-containing protein n=1 Tax=Iningainema tapete BLCC-T55 TaxID=2748662 RepID=A0A8J6XLJ0_9CYAN|nr:WD40 repeat domain-containing protein [Iningainema tapete]MBD2775287.1 WD40 repeat domain-containing protein [Iningainema tapete BLCC-T55]
MDWISLLKSQQADFLQRVKKPKTHDLYLLESQVKGCHSEVVAFWEESLTKLLSYAKEQAEIIALNPPPTPPEYPETTLGAIPFAQYFQQQAEVYLLRELVVDKAIAERFGKQVKKVPLDAVQNMVLDDEGNLRGESKFSYSLTANPKISIQVYATDGESVNSLKKDKIKWSITQDDVKNHQVLIFLCLFAPFSSHKRGYEKPVVIMGFLPTNQIEFSEPKLYITPSHLWYIGGVSWYLESLITQKNQPSVLDETVTVAAQTVLAEHPLKNIIGDWECWQTLKGHKRGINCLAFSSRGKNGETSLLASGSRGETKLWDLTKGELIGTLSEHPWIVSGIVDEVNSLAFSPDGYTLVSGGADSTIKLWHVGALDLIDILHKHNGMVRCVAFTSNGRMLATGGDDRTVMFWDLRLREVAFALSLDDTVAHSIAFSPDGRMVTGSYRKIKVWRVPEVGLPQPQLLHSFTAHSHIVRSLAISGDGKILVSASRDKTIKIWRLETGELIHSLKGHRDEVFAIAMSPDGQIIASGSADKTIKLWHVETGELLATFTGHTHTVTALAFTVSGEILVSGSLDKTIKIWQKS